MNLSTAGAAKHRPLWFWGVAAYVAASVGWLIAQPIKGLHSLEDLNFVDPLTAARILRMGSRCIYCPAAQQAVGASYLHQSFPTPDSSNFVDPPPAAFVLQPLAGLAPHTALAILLTISWICLAIAAYLLYRCVLPKSMPVLTRATIVGASLVTMPIAASVWEGQWVQFLLLALVVATLLVQRGHKIAGGVVLSILFLKFQLIWLTPVVLIGTRQWRILAGLACGGALWAISSVLILGVDHLGEWQAAVSAAYNAVPYTLGLPGLVATVSSSILATYVCLSAVGLVIVFFTWRYGPRLRAHPGIAIGVGLTASMVSTPHLLPYDLTLLALPLCLWARNKPYMALSAALFIRFAQELSEIFKTQVHVEWMAFVVVAAGLVALTPNRPRQAVAS